MSFGVEIPFSDHTLLLQTLSTITFPTFREFVLEGLDYISQFIMPPSKHWRGWGTIDKFLVVRFAEREGFKVIIRMDEFYGRKTLKVHARKGFPLLTSRGCVHFELFHLATRYRPYCMFPRSSRLCALIPSI